MKHRVLFSHWMEKYKNLLLNVIVQILQCFRSHFHPEKKQEGKFTPCGQRNMAGNTFKTISCKFMMKFLPSPCPLWRMWWTCQIAGSQSLDILCWQTNFFIQGKSFACLPIVMMKVKCEMYNTVICMFENLLNNFINLMCSNSTKCFKINSDIEEFLFSLDSKTFLLQGEQKTSQNFCFGTFSAPMNLE